MDVKFGIGYSISAEETLEIPCQLSRVWVPESGETGISGSIVKSCGPGGRGDGNPGGRGKYSGGRRDGNPGGIGKYPCYHELPGPVPFPVPVPWVVKDGKVTKFYIDYQKYWLDLKRSEGFYFEKHPGTWYLPYGSVKSYISTTQDLLEMEDYGRRALEIFNKNHGEKNQFVGIVRANYEHGGPPWIRYYITFHATKVVAADPPKEESAVRVFQARVLFCGIQHTEEIEFCRLEQPFLSD